MTISTTTSTRVSYTGNGSTTDFAVNYPIFKDGATTHFLKVLKKTIATGAVEELVENTGYTVTQSGGDPSTGTVTISPAISSAYRIYILSDLPALQELDLVNGTNIDVTRIEYQFDYLTMYNQQQLEVNTRAIILPETSDETSIDFPSFDGAAEGEIPTVNSTLDGYVYKSADELVSIAAFDISTLTAESTVDTAADFAAMYDTSAGAMRKVLIEDLVPASGDTAVHGDVQQIQFTTKTDTATIACTAGEWHDVTGVSVDITPARKNSKLLVGGWVSVGTDGAWTSFRIAKEGAVYNLLDRPGLYTSANFGNANVGSAYLNSVPFMFEIPAGTTSVQTIKLQVARQTTGDAYINRTTTDTNNIQFVRSCSHIWVAEVIVNDEATSFSSEIHKSLDKEVISLTSAVSTTQRNLTVREGINIEPLGSTTYNLIFGGFTNGGTSNYNHTIFKNNANALAATSPSNRRSVHSGYTNPVSYNQTLTFIDSLSGTDAVNYSVFTSANTSDTIVNNGIDATTQNINTFRAPSYLTALHFKTGGTFKSITSTNILTAASTSIATGVTYDPSLSVTLTPTNSGNKLLVAVNFNSSATQGGDAAGCLRLDRDGSNIAIADTAGNRSLSLFSKFVGDDADMNNFNLVMAVNASAASATTIKATMRHNNAGSKNITINRSITDTDTAAFMRGVSQIAVIDIDTIA